jgi:hypothetical protein
MKVQMHKDTGITIKGKCATLLITEAIMTAPERFTGMTEGTIQDITHIAAGIMPQGLIIHATEGIITMHRLRAHVPWFV